jgi:hypothetical protein
MTELARGLLRELRRRADQLVPQAEPSPKPVTVQVRLRAGADPGSTVADVEAVINRHRRELGLAPLPVATGPSQPETAARISFHGRPLAVAKDDARVVDEVDRILCRAPSLLLEDWTSAVGVTLSASELADCGHDVSAVPSTGAADPPPERLRLEVPLDILRRVNPGDDELVVAMRARLHERTGVLLPDLDLAVAERAGAHGAELADARGAGVRLWVNDVRVARRAEHVHAARGAAPADTLEEVVDWATGELSARAAWLVSESGTEEELNALALRSPRLEEALRSAYSVRDLTRCLRELVTGGDSVRNLARIVWLLVERAADRAQDLAEGQAAVDPVVLASAVRQRRNADNWTGRVPTPQGPWLPLDEKVETALLDSDPARVGWGMWSVAEAVVGTGTERPPTVVVERAAAIPLARRAMQAAGVSGPPRVVASAEVTLDAEL